MNSFSDCDGLRAKLDHKLRYPWQPIAFVVGSGLTCGTIPGVSRIVSAMRTYVSGDPSDPDIVKRFDASVTGQTASERYQQAASFLFHNKEQRAVNEIIRACVFLACENLDYREKKKIIRDEKKLWALEQFGRWKLDPGVRSFGQLLRKIPDDVRGSVLTTNFDPLIEVAVRDSGSTASSQWLDGDGKIHVPDHPGDVSIVHMHGYWRRGDTLNTAFQLTESREELDASIRERLRKHFVVVIGYGGWKDAFTQSLLQRITERESLEMEIAWAEFEPLCETRLSEGLLGELRKFHSISFFGGVDVNVLFPALIKQLGSRTLPTLSEQHRPPIPKIPKK